MSSLSHDPRWKNEKFKTISKFMSNFNDSVCNRCGSVMKLVPAGTSKRTGKKYAAFKACPDRECNSTNYSSNTLKPAISRDSGASSDRFNELMSVLNEIQGQILELSNKLDDLTGSDNRIGNEKN